MVYVSILVELHLCHVGLYGSPEAYIHPSTLDTHLLQRLNEWCSTLNDFE